MPVKDPEHDANCPPVSSRDVNIKERGQRFAHAPTIGNEYNSVADPDFGRSPGCHLALSVKCRPEECYKARNVGCE